jgi:hypothetical protein
MEDKTILTDKINLTVKEIVAFLEQLSNEKLHQSTSGKWSAAEQIIHLNKSVAPINMAFSLPKITFLVFGKANSSEGFEAIVNKYQQALSNGGKASKQYEPSESTSKKVKAEIIHAFKDHYSELTKKLQNWSEEDLDTYRLPHPLIGKITMRDMMHFTIYHLQHHLKSMKELVTE